MAKKSTTNYTNKMNPPKTLDDNPFYGIQLDEYGFMVLNTNDIMNGKEPPFRGRMYSKGMKEYYEENRINRWRYCRSRNAKLGFVAGVKSAGL